MTKPRSFVFDQAYINGKWCRSLSGEVETVKNPADGSVISNVPWMDGKDACEAINAAQSALPQWSKRLVRDRADILSKFSKLMIENRDELALLMTLEQGKPLKESKGEIEYAASFFEWFAHEGRRAYGQVIPPHQADKRLIVIRQPVGVCVAITPWNFPSAMITRKVAPALAAGCTIVVKPASETPLSALALAQLSIEAGVPAGVFNVVIGDSKSISASMTQHPSVRHLSFTGSTEVGKILMKQCADSVIKVSLELGGHAPFIVFDDADIDLAVEGAIQSKFRNSGQTCVCANRIYVQRTVYHEFAEKFTQAVKALNVGDGRENSCDQGPLIDMVAVEKVEHHIKDAMSKGASLLCGGNRHVLGGSYFEPTVLGDASEGMSITTEETFGPVAPLYRFSDDEDVIKLANNSRFGLASYFYSKDISRIWKVAEALEYGMVGVNSGVISTEVAPFGGVKQSGIGREGSSMGIEEYLETKYICIGEISQ